MYDYYKNEISKKIDEVYKNNPFFINHRIEFPWATGWIGNPLSKKAHQTLSRRWEKVLPT